MKTFLLIIILVHPLFGRSQNAAAIAKQYWNSVVLIVTQDENRQNLAIGSGLILENGRVVTNYHVIEGAKYAYALSESGAKYSVDGLFSTDEKNDLALLSVPGIPKSTVRLSSEAIQVGQRIYAIGNPEGLSNTISDGIISGKRTLNGASLIQITAPISPGSSGGPIVDDLGQVIGIAMGAITSGQNLNFAIPISFVLPMLSSTTITSLSVPARKEITTSASVTTNIANGVRVVDVEYECNEYDPGQPCKFRSLSINNALQQSVRKIKVIFILYSAAGMPIDYIEKTLCREEIWNKESKQSCYLSELVEIKPGLSKSFHIRYTALDKQRVFRKMKGEKLIIRILDFELVRD
jgi:hypothetical protein